VNQVGDGSEGDVAAHFLAGDVPHCACTGRNCCCEAAQDGGLADSCRTSQEACSQLSALGFDPPRLETGQLTLSSHKRSPPPGLKTIRSEATGCWHQSAFDSPKQPFEIRMWIAGEFGSDAFVMRAEQANGSGHVALQQKLLGQRLRCGIAQWIHLVELRCAFVDLADASPFPCFAQLACKALSNLSQTARPHAFDPMGKLGAAVAIQITKWMLELRR
jgi:hypothetical protein